MLVIVVPTVAESRTADRKLRVAIKDCKEFSRTVKTMRINPKIIEAWDASCNIQ